MSFTADPEDLWVSMSREIYHTISMPLSSSWQPWTTMDLLTSALAHHLLNKNVLSYLKVVVMEMEKFVIVTSCKRQYELLFEASKVCCTP